MKPFSITSTARARHGRAGLKSWIALLALSLLAGGCGSTGDGTAAIEPVPSADCQSGSSTECGVVYVGLTDAEGDFLSYSVDVVSLQLQKADGTAIETLPMSSRIDFANYVDLTEFLTAATVPPGTYISGSITLDYASAELIVESGESAKEAVAVDASGAPLSQVTLKVMLADRERLVVTRGRPSLLTVDFDLAASHEVDTSPTPAVAIAEHYIVAEIDPLEEKEIRVRGPLLDVDAEAMSYRIALRPNHARTGDFGRVDIKVTETTEFEVNSMAYRGSEGLRALADAGRGTPTVAFGTLDTAAREFTAAIVLAGDSVPGASLDAVKGHVIARFENELVVRGATVVLRDAERAFFRDDVTVSIGPETRVFKRTHDGMLDIADISIGQAVTIRGQVIANDELGVHLDATAGAVRMHITHLSGIVNRILPGQTDIALRAIDRRRVDIFDFSGTGSTPATDADPSNYEIATGNLQLDPAATGRPVVVRGFPNRFGAAPPDFEGRTVVDFAEVRSALGVGWGSAGTVAPFISSGSEGLVIDNSNPDIDQRHFIKQGPVLIDLLELRSDTTIVPRESGRKLFGIKQRDSLQLYADFDDFTRALALELDGATAARSMYARGHYDSESNVFTAYKVGIYLLEP